MAATSTYQITHGVHRGVNLEGWDDSIHVEDDTQLDLSDIEFPKPNTDFSVSICSIALNHLDPRLFRYANCTAALQCA